MKVLAVLCFLAVCLATVMAMSARSEVQCPYAGAFSDEEDACAGFHVCSFDRVKEALQYIGYFKCSGRRVFNGHECVPEVQFTCPQ